MVSTTGAAVRNAVIEFVFDDGVGFGAAAGFASFGSALCFFGASGSGRVSVPGDRNRHHNDPTMTANATKAMIMVEMLRGWEVFACLSEECLG